MNMYKQTNKSGESTQSPLTTPGRTLLLVLALLRVFFSEFSGFASSTKTIISNSNSIKTEDPHDKPDKTDEAFTLNIVIC